MYPNSQPNYVGSGRVSAKVERLSNQALADNSMDLEGKILLILKLIRASIGYSGTI